MLRAGIISDHSTSQQNEMQIYMPVITTATDWKNGSSSPRWSIRYVEYVTLSLILRCRSETRCADIGFAGCLDLQPHVTDPQRFTFLLLHPAVIYMA